MKELVLEKRVNVRIVFYSLANLAKEEAVKKGISSLGLLNRMFIPLSLEGSDTGGGNDTVILYTYTSLPFGISWNDAVKELEEKFDVTIKQSFLGIDLLNGIPDLRLYPLVDDQYVVTGDVALACFCDQGKPLPQPKPQSDLAELEQLSLSDEK